MWCRCSAGAHAGQVFVVVVVEGRCVVSCRGHGCGNGAMLGHRNGASDAGARAGADAGEGVERVPCVPKVFGSR